MIRKIMFVCMGNICRSPLAEAVFCNQAGKLALNEKYTAGSSGVIGYHIGEPADRRMRHTASKHGVSINHRAQQLTEQHMRDFDLILAMDKSNIAEIKRICGVPELLEKVKLFREYDPDNELSLEVPDPYYGGNKGFENVFSIVERTVAELLDILEKENDE